MRFDIPEARILLVDDDEPFRSGLATDLRKYGFKVVEASTSPSALEIATRQKPSVCVLETQLSGVDGFQFLKYLRSRHVFRLLPVVVLTRSVTKEALSQLVHLGVHAVFVKPSLVFEQLICRIMEVSPLPDLFGISNSRQKPSTISDSRDQPSSVFGEPSSQGASSVSEASENQELELPRMHPLGREELERLACLKALPSVIEDVIDTASRPMASLEDLEQVLRKDPVIASQVIRAANSAAFLRGAPVSRIDEALQLMGFKNVVRIAMACGIVSRSDQRRETGDDLRELWRNSLANAMVMERLSTRQDAPRSYAMALLRNVPVILLVQHLEKDWPAWREWTIQRGVLFGQLVQESCGISMGELVDSVYGAMNLPKSLSEPLSGYYRFYMARERLEPGLVARKLDLVDQIAIYLGRSGFFLSEVRCIHQREVDGSAFLSLTGDGFSKELELLEASIGILGGGRGVRDLPQLGQLVVWRDARWSPFDPVVSFLEQISDCVTVNFVQDLVQSNRPALAIVEPRTPEWDVLRNAKKPVVVLHTESADPSEFSGSMRSIRLPIAHCQLAKELQEALR